MKPSTGLIPPARPSISSVDTATAAPFPEQENEREWADDGEIGEARVTNDPPPLWETSPPPAHVRPRHFVSDEAYY